MMTSEKREELNEAVNEIVRFNLWRRGRTDCYSRRKDYQKVLGESLEIVCGGVLDYLELQEDFDRVVQEKNNLKNMAMQGLEAVKEAKRLRSERNHFKAILAALRIPHKRKKKR